MGSATAHPLRMALLVSVGLALAPGGGVRAHDRDGGGPAAALSSQTGAAAVTEVPAGHGGQVVVPVRRGDTLADLLDRAEVDRAEARDALAALGFVLLAAFGSASAPNQLRPGQAVAVRLGGEGAAADALTELAIEAEPGRTALVRRVPEGPWVAEERRTTWHRHLVRAEGEVRDGFFESLRAAGVPASFARDLIRALSQRLDLQRDLRPGDRFVVGFERFRDDEGALLGDGRALYAELHLSGGDRLVVRYFEAEEGGGAGWYDETGRPLRGGLLRTPLDGARVTSGFGPRRHPVLGFTQAHKGVDFAAPAGTPVLAAADGVVVSARVERGYGRIVRLRHPGRTETRYAHLSRFAPGLAPGLRVRQGDAIGAVGASGLATGPHLHYEVVLNGKAIDPASAQAVGAGAERLAGRELTAFQVAARALDRRMAVLAGRTEMAMAE